MFAKWCSQGPRVRTLGVEGKSDGTASPSAVYPSWREADVVLRDGSTLHLRPTRPGDHADLVDFYSRLSPESRTFRFFSGGGNFGDVVTRLLDLDYRRRYGLVATSGRDAKLVAHAFYAAGVVDRAEVALAVSDELQGKGVGTILLGHLAQAAEAAGIPEFEAEVMYANDKMTQVFLESGFPVRRKFISGNIHFEFPTELSGDALERFESRERTAAAAALRYVLEPKSVAVIGASRSQESVGGRIVLNLLEAGFKGQLHPVNRSAVTIQGLTAFASIGDVPAPVEMAVIAIPAAEVVEVARQCAASGVRALVVISSGFGEAGAEGVERQRELLAVCRESGMRLVGPNCLGVLNTAPAVRLNATFAIPLPPPGSVGFMSQSGALGISAVSFAAARGIGISTFVSVGNKADISGNDLLQYWEQDSQTKVCLLYLESFGNPRKFARVARRVARQKPIVVVKSGRSPAGSRATSSHTGALIADSDLTVDALFNQAGVIRTDTVAELLDVAALLAGPGAPTGPRVGIVTNAGGPGILCADTLQTGGLEVPAFSPGLRKRLAGFLPGHASSLNPVDMTAAASGDQYRQVLNEVAASGEVDALVTIFIPPMITAASEVAEAVRAAAKATALPLLAVFMSAGGPPQSPDDEVAIPTYSFPEEAGRALVHAARYAVWRREPEGTVPVLEGIQRPEADGLLAHRLAAGGGWLEAEELAALLQCYGLPLAESRVARSAREAGRFAAEMGGLVAVKAIAKGLLHKTEVGAVRLDLRGGAAVRRAAGEMTARMRPGGLETTGFIVQRMAPAGVEMLVGVVHDRHFGPVVACGAGGTQAELLRDVSLRITPLSDRDAAAMIRSLQTFPLLEGFRGAPHARVEALEDVLLRVSALVEDHPELAEMDLNPVVVGPAGAVIIDARARVAEPEAPRPLIAR